MCNGLNIWRFAIYCEATPCYETSMPRLSASWRSNFQQTASRIRQVSMSSFKVYCKGYLVPQRVCVMNNMIYHVAPPGWAHEDPNPFTADGSYGPQWSCFRIREEDDGRGVNRRWRMVCLRLWLGADGHVTWVRIWPTSSAMKPCTDGNASSACREICMLIYSWNVR